MTSKPGSSPSGKAGEGGAAFPSGRLVGLHRHNLTNVLIVGATADLREQVARAFHRESPLAGGAFVIVDCSSDEERLRLAMQGWTGAATVEGNPLRVAEQGTLFLDQVEALSLDCQRLLFALARQMTGEPAVGTTGARPGRLVAGSPRALSVVVAEGRFMPALYDALDKVRVELGTGDQPST